ncbi:MAG TPA: hypothetical protein PLQ57_05690 [Saprospiraceae bacterium]|nr:hypothetical protein [Saprospiraceae bacterium]
MNKQDRKELEKAINDIENAKSLVEEILDNEQSKFDNLPEGLQISEKGQKMEENISALDDARNLLEEAIQQIQTAAE